MNIRLTFMRWVLNFEMSSQPRSLDVWHSTSEIWVISVCTIWSVVVSVGLVVLRSMYVCMYVDLCKGLLHLISHSSSCSSPLSSHLPCLSVILLYTTLSFQLPLFNSRLPLPNYLFSFPNSYLLILTFWVKTRYHSESLLHASTFVLILFFYRAF